MDRRDGGDPQAPPRPPKLLPRVHRPRAPEPIDDDDMLNETTRRRKSPAEEEELRTRAAGTVGAVGTAATTAPAPKTEFQRILRMIGSSSNVDDTTHENNATAESTTTTTTRGQQQSQSTSSSPSNRQQQQLNSITLTTATAPRYAADDLLVHGNSFSSSHSSSSSSRGSRSRSQTHNPNSSSATSATNTTATNNGTFIINTSQEDSFLGTHPDYDNYQIHHLTYLPQRPSSLSRNSSHVSTSSSSSITAANSFTRRRLPPTPGASVPLLTINGSASAISTGSFFSHFHNAETAAAPVTLAQPRPECQRHSNEYVDTPLRTAQQLQHATRNQHPAGQQDNGPTTTHHILLLPQRGLRGGVQTQQHAAQNSSTTQNNNNNNHQIHSTRANASTAAAAGTATVNTAATTASPTPPTQPPPAAGADRTDGFIHSQPHKSTTTSTSPLSLSSTTTSSSPTSLADSKQAARSTAAHQLPPPPPPITKQPAISNCKPGQRDLHDIHHHHLHHNGAQPLQHQSELGGGSTNNNSTGIPIISTGHIAPNSITCPYCGMCRCEQCQTPRLLPERWLCNKTCLCSAETVIDYASCLCCAKAFFYHCARDSDMDYDDGTGTSYLENPCSCGPYKRAERLGWLGALSLVLPCLWCYWPMRGCAKLGQLCYGYVAGRGCRCTQPNSPVHMLSVMPRTPNGSGGGTPNNNRALNNAANAGDTTTQHTKSAENEQVDVKSHHHYHLHHHHHHHHDDSKASQMLCEPEKRLLDSTHEF